MQVSKNPIYSLGIKKHSLKLLLFFVGKPYINELTELMKLIVGNSFRPLLSSKIMDPLRGSIPVKL